jgi:hypothetical protein
MPFKRPAITIEEYQAVYDSVIERLVESGYGRDDISLDPVCRSGVQSFYVPCTNKAYPGHAYFRASGFKPGEFERHAIDPLWYASTRSQPDIKFTRSTTKGPSAEQLAEIDSLATKIKGRKEGRHHPFFDLAVRMRSAGFSPFEIERGLMNVAGNDNKMKGKVRGAMKSLKEYG